MEYLHAILLLLGGILALSAFIVAKKPDAKDMIDKLVPFQAFIGVALLGVGLVQWIRAGIVDLFKIVSHYPLYGITALGAVFGAIILGFFFGMPQIAKWIPGESSAEAKAMELSKKIAPYQMIFGVIALASGVLLLLYRLGVLKVTF